MYAVIETENGLSLRVERAKGPGGRVQITIFDTGDKKEVTSFTIASSELWRALQLFG